jgi:hypothetical protein
MHPLDPIRQVGQFRGQILVVGNDFVHGGSMQLYAACYDCLVAENTFRKFGFSNWGRNPHGAGWQPNLNNIMADNTMMVEGGGMSVRGCSTTCTDVEGKCTSAPHTAVWAGCGNNTLLGRDCAPFSSAMGSFRGAVNSNLAWRRNTMAHFYIDQDSGHRQADIPVLDGGLVEHTLWTTPGAMVNLTGTTNVVVRD